MKLFNWMQNKFSGKSHSVSIQNHTRQEPCKEEFSDWPQGLLAIGTFGIRDTKENSKQKYIQENPPSTQDGVQEHTPEEVRELEKELESILNKQVGSNLEWSSHLQMQPSLEDDRRAEDTCYIDSHLQQEPNLVVSKGKDTSVDKTKTSNAINKRSLSFLIKKMFICGSGLTTSPNLRDQVPESRMEKILRAIIHKKIYPQNPTPSVSAAKKYLKNKRKPEDGADEKVDDGSKWVKTDSEFIVLEI